MNGTTDSNDDEFIHRDVEICKHCKYFFRGVLRNNSTCYCCERPNNPFEDNEIFDKRWFEALEVPDDCEMKTEYLMGEWNK